MAELSILNGVKRILGLTEDYDVFDEELIIHINSVFATLNQLGVGPEEGFFIVDDASKWDLFLAGETNPAKANSVKSYMGMKVRLIFDPPPTSFAQEAMLKQATEIEWRLNVHREGVKYP